MLFSNLSTLIQKGVTVNFIVSGAADGKLEVAVHPSTEQASGMNLVAKSFVGTPAELDAEFADIIGGYAAANLSLKEQLEAVQVMVKEAERQASEEAAKNAAAKPASKSSGSATSKPTAPASKPAPTLMDTNQDHADAESGEDGESSAAGAAAEPMAFTL